MRKGLSDKIRFSVFRNDNFTCSYCGRKPEDGVVLHVDHILPVSKGGTNQLENLTTSCQSCNLGKMTEEVQKEMIERIRNKRDLEDKEDCTYAWYLRRLKDLKINYEIESKIVYEMYKNWENNIEVPREEICVPEEKVTDFSLSLETDSEFTKFLKNHIKWCKEFKTQKIDYFNESIAWCDKQIVWAINMIKTQKEIIKTVVK